MEVDILNLRIHQLKQAAVVIESCYSNNLHLPVLQFFALRNFLLLKPLKFSCLLIYTVSKQDEIILF